jgi:hypothetical protein
MGCYTSKSEKNLKSLHPLDYVYKPSWGRGRKMRGRARKTEREKER